MNSNTAFIAMIHFYNSALVQVLRVFMYISCNSSGRTVTVAITTNTYLMLTAC